MTDLWIRLRCWWRGHPVENHKVHYVGKDGVEQIDQWSDCECNEVYTPVTRTRIRKPYDEI